MSDTSSIQHETFGASQTPPGAPRHESGSTRREGGSTANERGDDGQDDSASNRHRIGSSVVPMSSLAAPDERTVISSSPPAPAPSHRDESSPSELGRLLEGERLDHFELEEFIGGGGMGAVFRGVDTLLGRTVAIKVLSRRNGGDEETSRRFNNEAQSAARLDHENIARVYYVGQDRGWHYIVFEFIEGENLRDLVARNGPLPVAEVVYYISQIAEALAHAAGRDVVHRDIKPSNVLVTRGRRAKLVDMGLARLHQVETSREDITASGVTLGTFDYISPEQARDPRLADIRSDVYSLGCTAYYMLTGRPPFPEGTVLQKLLQHQGDEPPDPREFRRDLPPQLCDILSRMLVKNPADRYQSADALLDDLGDLSQQLGLDAPRRARETVWVEPATSSHAWVERYLPWLIPAGLLIAIVAVVEIVGNMNPLPEPPLPEPMLTAQGDEADDTGQPTEGSPIEPATSGQDRVADDNPKAMPIEPSNAADPPAGGEPKEATGEAPAEFTETSSSPPPAEPAEQPTSSMPVEPAESPAADESPRVVLNPESATPALFDSINNALQDAQTGDIIELRFNGVQTERPWRIEKQKLTIRAAEGYRPVIRFIPSGTDPVLQPRDMITVSGGELSLINLQIHLDLPAQLQSDRWSLFHLVLADRLRLDRTTLTIKNAAADGSAYHQLVAFFKVDAPLATGATFNDSASDPQRTTIDLRNCVARGEADLLSGDRLGSVTFSWENGLFCTSERIASLTSEDFRDDAGDRLDITLQHLTADLRQGMIQIDAPTETPELYPIQVEVAESIVLSSAPLFDFSGSGNVKNFREKLAWKGERNFYEGVGVFWRIDDQFADDFAEVTFSEWQSLWGAGNEASQRSGAVGWAALPEKSKPYWQRGRLDYSLDMEDIDNPALSASTDGTTDAGMQPDFLPREVPLTGDSSAFSEPLLESASENEIVIPFRPPTPAGEGVVPAGFEAIDTSEQDASAAP